MSKEKKDDGQQNNNFSFKERLYYFYTEEFENIIKKYKRGQNVSMILKLVYAGHLLSLMFAIELNKIIQSKNDNLFLKPFMALLECTKIFPLIQYALELNDTLTSFIYTCLMINLVFLLYILFRAVLRIVNQNTRKEDYEWTDDISSAFFQFYLHFFAVPFFEISIKCFAANSNIAGAIINSMFTIGIGIMLTL